MDTENPNQGPVVEFYTERVQSAVFAAAQAIVAGGAISERQVEERCIPQIIEQLIKANTPVAEGMAWIQLVERRKYEENLFIRYLTTQMPDADEADLPRTRRSDLVRVASLVQKVLASPFRPRLDAHEFYPYPTSIFQTPEAFSNPEPWFRFQAYQSASTKPSFARECQKEIVAAAAKETEEVFKQAAQKALTAAQSSEDEHRQ